MRLKRFRLTCPMPTGNSSDSPDTEVISWTTKPDHELNYICGNFTFETLNLHVRESTCERIYTGEDCATRPDTGYGMRF